MKNQRLKNWFLLSIQIKSENSSVGEILNRVILSRRILVAVPKRNHQISSLLSQSDGSEEKVVTIRSDLPSNVIKSLSSCHCH